MTNVDCPDKQAPAGTSCFAPGNTGWTTPPPSPPSPYITCECANGKSSTGEVCSSLPSSTGDAVYCQTDVENGHFYCKSCGSTDDFLNCITASCNNAGYIGTMTTLTDECNPGMNKYICGCDDITQFTKPATLNVKSECS